MTQQQPGQRTVEVDAVSAPSDEALSRVKVLVARLEEAPRSVELATSLNRAVTALARQPTREAFELLHDLAALPLLARAKDQNGWPCRAAVLSTWLELGYPYALELTPEDLEYARQHVPGDGTGWLNVTSVLAILSAMLNVPATLFIVVALMSLSLSDLLFAVPTGLMALHAISLLGTLRLERPGNTNVSWLRGLGAIGLLGPLAAALSIVALGEAGGCLFIGCLPMGLASVSALIAASRLKQHDA